MVPKNPTLGNQSFTNSKCMYVCICTFFLILGLTKLLCHVKIDLGGGKNEFQLFVKIIGITIDCEAS